MTDPLPERIAAAIDDLTVAQAECTWAEAGTFTLRVDKEARAKEAREARSKLVEAIAEVVAERDLSVREREALAKSYRETVDQRDDLIRRAQLAVWQGLTSEKPHELIPGEPLRAQLIVLGELCGAIARAQSGQPDPVQQPSTDDVAIQGGECAFFDELPKGPSIGRFSDSERAELDDLKRKAFKAGES